jgi:hypothetical protein
MRVSSACQKNMLPYSSLGIRYMIPETITISTPLPIYRQILSHTVKLFLSTLPVDFSMTVQRDLVGYSEDQQI